MSTTPGSTTTGYSTYDGRLIWVGLNLSRLSTSTVAVASAARAQASVVSL